MSAWNCSDGVHGSYLCVLCKEYLLETPRQAPCGERICSPCWRERKERFARSVVYNVAIAINIIQLIALANIDVCDKLYTISRDVFCELFICSGKDVLCPICQQKIVLEEVYIATANIYTALYATYTGIRASRRALLHSLVMCHTTPTLALCRFVCGRNCCFILSYSCVQCRLE